MSKFESLKNVFLGKKNVINHDIVREIKYKHTVKNLRHIETFLSRKKLFFYSSLVSTLEFVLGRDVQLPQESTHSLFSYTPYKLSLH